MNKKILFILFVSIGSVVVALLINYFLGISDIAEYVALFTSVSTAIYAILAEPKERTEPILRVTPILKRKQEIVIGDETMSGGLGLVVWVENIGYSIAKDIEVKCQIRPNKSISLKNNGIFEQALLAPKEIVRYDALGYIGKGFLSQQLIIETFYSNEDGKRQKPIKNKFAIKDLEEGLREVKTQ